MVLHNECVQSFNIDQSFPWGVSSDLSNDIFYKVEALQGKEAWVLAQVSSFWNTNISLLAEQFP